MRRNHTMRRVAALFFCVALLGAMMLPAGAIEAYETVWVTNSEGTGEIDSLYGVASRFSSGNCWDYVRRFYEELYGIRLVAVSGRGPQLREGCEGLTIGKIAEDETPRTGDILYGTGAMRGSRDHYAIVKWYDAETQQVVLIEENFQYGGKAAKERRIAWPSTAYNAYRITDENGAIVPDLLEVRRAEAAAQAAEQAQAAMARAVKSDWAEPSLAEAAELGIFAVQEDYTALATREQFCEMAVHIVEQMIGEPERLRPLEGEMEAGYIGLAYQIGLIDGTGDSLNPDGVLTREQACKILASLFEMVGTLPEAEPAVLANFADAAEISDWAVPYAARMAACGVMQGSSDGEASYFAPKQTLTLEMAVVLMLRLYHNPTPEVALTAPIETYAATTAAMATVAHGEYLYRATTDD